MAAVDKAEVDFEERVTETQVWFSEARDELRAAQGELEEHKWELILKQADIEKAQEVAKNQAAADEAAPAIAADLAGIPGGVPCRL